MKNIFDCFNKKSNFKLHQTIHDFKFIDCIVLEDLRQVLYFPLNFIKKITSCEDRKIDIFNDGNYLINIKNNKIYINKNSYSKFSEEQQQTWFTCLSDDVIILNYDDSKLYRYYKLLHNSSDDNYFNYANPKIPIVNVSLKISKNKLSFKFLNKYMTSSINLVNSKSMNIIGFDLQILDDKNIYLNVNYKSFNNKKFNMFKGFGYTEENKFYNSCFFGKTLSKQYIFDKSEIKNKVIRLSDSDIF